MKKLLGLVALKRFIDNRPKLKGRLRRGAKKAVGSNKGTPDNNEPTYGIRR